MKKYVIYPIEVLSGGHCAKYKEGLFCQYFNASNQTCELGFSNLKENESGCLKPDKCKNLVSFFDSTEAFKNLLAFTESLVDQIKTFEDDQTSISEWAKTIRLIWGAKNFK